MKKCDYAGCTEPAIDDGPGMKLCAKHDAEFTQIIREAPFSPGKLLAFWVRASGGAKKLAQKMVGDTDGRPGDTDGDHAE